MNIIINVQENYLLNTIITLDIESCKVTSTLDIDALSSYLIHDCSMSEKRVQNSLKKISHIYK